MSLSLALSVSRHYSVVCPAAASQCTYQQLKYTYVDPSFKNMYSILSQAFCSSQITGCVQVFNISLAIQAFLSISERYSTDHAVSAGDVSAGFTGPRRENR